MTQEPRGARLTNYPVDVRQPDVAPTGVTDTARTSKTFQNKNTNTTTGNTIKLNQ